MQMQFDTKCDAILKKENGEEKRTGDEPGVCTPQAVGCASGGHHQTRLGLGYCI